jgi:hypothetical protein
MPTMLRRTLAALMLLAGCGQDIDLGSTRGPASSLAPKPTPTWSGGAPAASCPFEDPALLPAPEACPIQMEDSEYRGICVVSPEGHLMDPFGGPQLLRLPACPIGVFFTMKDPLPATDNIERAVWALKVDPDGKPAFVPSDEAISVPRTIEVIPAANSFFVRLDPRPSAGRRINVVVEYAELFAGRDRGPRSIVWGSLIGFLAGDEPNP